MARSLPDDVVDDDGVRGQEEVGETLRDLGELQPRAVKDLSRERARSADPWLSGPAHSRGGVNGGVPPAGSTCHS